MKRKPRSAAILTLHDAPSMTKRGRRKIADWLKNQAVFLLFHHDKLSKRYVARYLY